VSLKDVREVERSMLGREKKGRQVVVPRRWEQSRREAAFPEREGNRNSLVRADPRGGEKK